MSAWKASKPAALTLCKPRLDTQHKACKGNIPLHSFRNSQGGTEHLLSGATGCLKNVTVGERWERRGWQQQLFPARSPPGHAGHLNFKAHSPRLFSPPSLSGSQRPRPGSHQPPRHPWVHWWPSSFCPPSAPWSSSPPSASRPSGASTWKPWFTSSPCSSWR